jgi:hypothetical protein
MLLDKSNTELALLKVLAHRHSKHNSKCPVHSKGENGVIGDTIFLKLNFIVPQLFVVGED